MKIRTNVKAGGLPVNHNETLVRDSKQAAGLRVKTRLNRMRRSVPLGRLSLMLLLVLSTFTSARAQHPLRGSIKLSVILCKFSDSPTPPSTPYFQSLLFGQGTGSLNDYWSAVSNHAVYVEGTINGWYKAPITIAQAIAINQTNTNARGGGRDQLYQACYNAATQGGYTGSVGPKTVIITSPFIDSWGSPGNAFLWDTAPLGQIAHEVGHALYLNHSFSNDPYYFNQSWAEAGEYDDQWDIMSWAHTFGLVPYNGVHLDRQGWLARDQIQTVGADGYPGARVRLVPLYSSASGFKLLRVPCDPNDPFHYFTVEYRSTTGSDSLNPSDIVLIHETRKKSDGYYYLRVPKSEGG